MNTSEIKYNDRIIAFLDILGFERIVNEYRNNPQLISKIAYKLKRSKIVALLALNTKLKVLKVNTDQYLCRSFSDMSIISGPYNSHDDMLFISTWITFYQYLMCREEQTFIRGAIVYGDIYEDEDIVFGPALIDAYNLESGKTKAVWPRVIIDKRLLDKTTDTERRSDFSEFLRQDDSDNLVYLDYLRELFHLVTLVENKRILGQRKQDFGLPTELFKDHKEAILAQVSNILTGEKQGEDEDIVSKYESLSKYHNSTINGLRQVIKDLMENNDLRSELFDAQLKSINRNKLGLKYEPKYGAEKHPEQADMLNIIVVAANRIIENPPPNILETQDTVIIGQTDEVKLGKAINILSSEVPQELSKLDNALQESMIDINSFGLKKK